MTDDRPLRPATVDEIVDSLVFSLRFNDRKRVHTGDETMAKIPAERLVKHLEASGFVLMKRPPRPAHTTDGHRDPIR
jgi:hypothetical protein